MAPPNAAPDDAAYWTDPPPIIKPPPGAQHGKGGLFVGGNWVDIEDLTVSGKCGGDCSACPRSQSRNARKDNIVYDVVLIGAGCLGAAVARQLAKYNLSTLWLEAADDVSQGATKGNSGIVHAGYDDKPGTNRAKYCWKGNQLFAELDRDLGFGYQKNGSLVVAFNEQDMEHLKQLKKRGETNGVQYLRIVDQAELRKMEPHINPEAVGALYAREAGNVIPYEFAIALAENAVDNGVELKIRREVQALEFTDNEWKISVRHWEPAAYMRTLDQEQFVAIMSMVGVLFVMVGIWFYSEFDTTVKAGICTAASVFGASLVVAHDGKSSSIVQLVARAGLAEGRGGTKVGVDDMLVGGSGSVRIVEGQTVAMETVRARYIVNCAGGASDQIARMIGDDSFKIKPRIGDYILLNRNQGHLAKHTLFPCPDPKLGKGVLVQATLWSNLILGPTARDMHDPTVKSMTPKDIQNYILSKCKRLVPTFDAKETIHTFCGARAKSDRGDWIIEPSKCNPKMIHVAGIDSPGLAGSPAIAVDVIKLLQEAGLETPPNPNFNPRRDPIITPKRGMKGLKMGPVGKNDSDGKDEAAMAANVICKCERVTELEVVRALRRSLPIDSTQAIRKRTRAGMGHCQGAPDNYNCEARVKAIIARELGEPVSHVGGRPWPATSILTQRWIDDEEKEDLQDSMMQA